MLYSQSSKIIAMSGTNNLTNMEVIDKLETLLAEMRVEGDKLYNRNVKASAAKLRKKAQEGKALLQLVRVQSLDHKNALPTKVGGRRAAETDTDGTDTAETVDE